MRFLTKGFDGEPIDDGPLLLEFYDETADEVGQARFTDTDTLALRTALQKDGSSTQRASEGFWQTDSKRAAPTIRSRLNMIGTLSDASNFSRTEIVAAALLLKKEYGRMEHDGKISLIARLLLDKGLGFHLKSRIKKCIEINGLIQ